MCANLATPYSPRSRLIISPRSLCTLLYNLIGNDQILCGNVLSTFYLVTPMKDATRPAIAHRLCHLIWIICTTVFAMTNADHETLGAGPEYPDTDQVLGCPLRTGD